VEVATQAREDRSGNRLLACLPAPDRDRILSKRVPNFLKAKTVLFEPGEVVDAVYFPLDGVISLVTPLEDGAIVEVATIGNEGLWGSRSCSGAAWQYAPSRRWPDAR
jgi:CRP-like cAMP-binding protein